MQFNLLDRMDTVLVVVDVQEPFLRNIFEKDRVISGVIKLIEAAKALNVPIITTLQYKTRMGDVIEDIAQALPAEERIDKTTFSCCGTKSFMDALEKLNRKTVLLCGVETHICINQTAHDLLRIGYNVQAAADAISSRKESDYHIGLDKMRQLGVTITSIEAVIFEMLKDAAAPEFKKILEVVK
jgi:nicotinamidase-related amidase